MTVAFAVASEVARDAVAALALERVVLTGESFASDFIRAVGAVVVVVAPVPAGYALAVRRAAELGRGALAVLVPAELVVLVVAVGAVVLEVARPPARDAALVLALELGRLVAFRAVLRQLVRSFNK